ncbi:ABC transporter substrate-binding protein [Hyphomicrobium sp.]|uniref:ABC transporter substrate-binding protein n=1 Tax=Hyphomicrobium sp. TaxID=82 RepID=UPI002FE225C0
MVGAIAWSALLPSPLAASPAAQRVAVLDWAIAETLFALGEPPIALVAASDWNRFVVEPHLPPGTADIGVQQEVNFELLASLRPDLILTSPFSQDQEPALARIAPVRRFTVFEPTSSPLERPRRLTRELGAMVGAERQAEALIAYSDVQLAACRARLARLRLPPLLLVSFLDARHVRAYGGVGLYQNVLDTLGLQNAWTKPTNAWGFATTGIEGLATDKDVRLVAFQPVPPDALMTLAQSPLWRELPFVKAGHMSILPPVLMFGALPAALRFAHLLTTELERVAG